MTEHQQVHICHGNREADVHAGIAELVTTEPFRVARTDYESPLARVTVVSDESYVREPFDAARHR